MSKTLDDLLADFDAAVLRAQATNREEMTPWACRRAGIRAVVTALRDELLRGKSKAATSTMLTVHVRGLFEGILAPREGEYTGGMNDLNVSPAAHAPVCEREKALIARLQEENQRLRAEIDQNRIDLEEYRRDVEALEEELKEIGGRSWRTPDPEVADPDLMREDAHERQRLEKEYPWKE